MLTLSSSTYKKDDFRAFADIMEFELHSYISCSDKGTNKCSNCRYKKPCYDLCNLYDYIMEKTK